MKKSLCLIVIVIVAAVRALSQPPSMNPEIRGIVSEVSPDSIRSTIAALAGFGTRHTLSDTLSQTSGIGAARRWIFRRFGDFARSSGDRMTVEFHETIAGPSRRIRGATKIVNVAVTLSPEVAGSEQARRVIVLSGHYDSRATDVMDSLSAAPGADDDGSGTALVLELARVFSKHSFDATIVFICFAGEEQGLLGATAWVERAQKSGTNIAAVFNNDMVGGIHSGMGTVDSTHMRIFSEAFNPLDTGAVYQQRISLGLENDGASRSLARHVQEIGERYVPGFHADLIYRLDRYLRGGDHIPFHRAGFPAIRLCEAIENYDHQHQNVRMEDGKQFGDLPQFVDADYCARIARVNAAAIASLAWAPAPPSGVKMLTSQLEYTSALHWAPNREQDLAGYLIRWRKTSSPAWEFSHFSADTTVSMDVSKDDFILGVQAVDRAGNASLVSLPVPSR